MSDYDLAGKRIGWFCSYVPLELISAAGMEAVRLHGRVEKIKVADSYLHANFCPFLKNLLDSGLRGVYSDLDGIVFANTCDGMRRLYDLWHHYVEKPLHYMLEIPKNRTVEAISYFSEQLKNLRTGLESDFGRTISDDRLKGAVSSLNDRRRAFQAIFEGQKDRRPTLRGSELFALCHEEAAPLPADIGKRRRSVVRDRVNDDAPSDGNPRILITGNTLHDLTLIHVVEDAQGSVVVLDTCNGFKHYSDCVDETSDPIEGIARRYLLKPQCPRMPGAGLRMDRLGRLIQEYTIDGVIFSGVQFCDYSMFEVPQMKAFLDARQVPLLILENDYLWWDKGRMKIRVEAFLEMVRGQLD